MSLEKSDLELIEKILYKNSDDIAVAIARSFERLEERIDSAESRVYSRLGDLQDIVSQNCHDMSERLKDTREAILRHDCFDFNDELDDDLEFEESKFATELV